MNDNASDIKNVITYDSNSNLGIGIDTGGTFTDAVIYDFDKRKVLCASKSLTTREDLSQGILRALDELPAELMAAAGRVSLSTTLATNACVENKGGIAHLILIGADRKVYEKVGSSLGLTDKSRIHFVDFVEEPENPKIPSIDMKSLDDAISLAAADDIDAIAIVQIFAREYNAAHEKLARRRAMESLQVPIVCGHELHGDLNVFRRGAEALLNARLIPIIQQFLSSISQSLNVRGVNPSVSIMRSDASLMSEEFTMTHPVETLVCGPAASAMGAKILADRKNAFVVDMGGTTTDIAIIQDGQPLHVDEGVRVGSWRTFVKGVYIDTFALGGDSGVHIKERKISLEDERYIPLCILSSTYPETDIPGRIRKFTRDVEYHTRPLCDFFVKGKPLPCDNEKTYGFTRSEIALRNALENGPLIYSEVAEIMSGDIYALNTSRLEREGYVMRAGFTPTDAMHIRGDFDKYDKSASMAACEFMCKCMATTPCELTSDIYDAVIKKLYCNIVRVGLSRRYKEYDIHGLPAEIFKLIELSYEERRRTIELNLGHEEAVLSDANRSDATTPVSSTVTSTTETSTTETAATQAATTQAATTQAATTQAGPNILNTVFACDYDLIGIGAPIHVFLPHVAKLLGTSCVISDNANVGNAVGAIASGTSATVRIEIKPVAGEDGGFIVYTPDENVRFETLDEAVEYAAPIAENLACNAAYAEGAMGELESSVKVMNNISRGKDEDVHLSTIVEAVAVDQNAKSV